jgi:Rps23 Pro-64 3,4-dihydroxylase Tpa1-like proline 4-hydroxylase
MSKAIAGDGAAPFCRIENFLAPGQCARLLALAVGSKSQFETSTTTTGAKNYRRSAVLYWPPERLLSIVGPIRSCMPFVTRSLGQRRFRVRKVEVQVTAHNDGDFFNVHTDNGDRITGRRVITFVYYLHRVPRRFAGGELKLFTGAGRKAPVEIEPRNNTIVFFRSDREHAVRRTRCRSRRFEDGRFTINGWICR